MRFVGIRRHGERNRVPVDLGQPVSQHEHASRDVERNAWEKTRFIVMRGGNCSPVPASRTSKANVTFKALQESGFSVKSVIVRLWLSS
jgi:hypothetical protein